MKSEVLNGAAGGGSVAAVVEQAAPARRARVSSESLLAQTARRLKRSYTALFGLGIVVLLILVAISPMSWRLTTR